MSILEDGPLRRILRERRKALLAQGERPEEIIRQWREKGVPQAAMEMAMKMADRWLEAVLK